VEQLALERWVVVPGPAVTDLQAGRAERLSARQLAHPEPAPERQATESSAMEVDPAPPAPATARPEVAPPPPCVASGPVRRRPLGEPAEAEPAFPAALLSIPVTGPPPPGSLADRTLAVLPPAWAPIIARDTEAGRGGRPGQGGPYSEAYLAGQPSKRRKLNSERKPRGEVAAVISRSLQVS
jgi:hypothetical protein